jgi:hypothetical protein
MRKPVFIPFLATVVLCLLPHGYLTSAAQAQVPTGGVLYSRQPVFRIPFETEGNDRRLQEIQLYVSEDQGQTWQKAGSARPGERGFNFRSDRDGMHWFTVRTIDLEGRSYPPTLQGTQPQLKVCVDTQPPVVVLRPGSRDGLTGVEWEIRDENLDLSSLTLEFRLPGNADWLPLTVDLAAVGQRYWNPGTNGAVDVRLRVRDLAKNETEKTLTLTPGSTTARTSGSPSDRDPSGYAGRTAAPGTRCINSKRISLNYEIREQGPSGVSALEIYWTRDGQKWDKLREDSNPQPPCVIDVQEEGIYGFTLILRSGANLSERAPRLGDQPQVWVEVDLTKPMVHWVNVEVDPVPQNNSVTITWKATDKNLGREPIALKYAKDVQGPWTEIVSTLENSGKFVWRMPPGVPWRFYVRAEATDRAGNVGFFETPKPIVVDLAKPKPFILGVEPAGGPGAGNSESAIMPPTGQSRQ